MSLLTRESLIYCRDGNRMYNFSSCASSLYENHIASLSISNRVFVCRNRPSSVNYNLNTYGVLPYDSRTSCLWNSCLIARTERCRMINDRDNNLYKCICYIISSRNCCILYTTIAHTRRSSTYNMIMTCTFAEIPSVEDRAPSLPQSRPYPSSHRAHPRLHDELLIIVL